MAWGVLDLYGGDELIQDKVRMADGSLEGNINDYLRESDGSQTRIFWSASIWSEPLTGTVTVDADRIFISNAPVRTFLSGGDRSFIA